LPSRTDTLLERERMTTASAASAPARFAASTSSATRSTKICWSEAMLIGRPLLSAGKKLTGRNGVLPLRTPDHMYGCLQGKAMVEGHQWRLDGPPNLLTRLSWQRWPHPAPASIRPL